MWKNKVLKGDKMKLNNEQIISCANGVIRTEQNELGIELHRFSREQEGFFYKTHPLFCKESFFNGYFGKNCRCTAGVSLDFETDAKEIEISFGKVEYTNNVTEQFLDLYVDKEYVKSFSTNDDIKYKASGKKQEYTLYFPTYSFPIVSGVELKDATIFNPIKKEIDILFMGDSITQGASKEVKPSNTYVMRVARGLNKGILNQGNSGFIYDKGAIEKVCDPKIIITAYGINDYFRKTDSQLEIYAIEFLEKLRETYKTSKIVSILPLWSMCDEEDTVFVGKREILKKVYEQYSDYIVDGQKMIEHNREVLADAVHPNEEGFKQYGENLLKELKRI